MNLLDKPIYSTDGLEAYADGTILLMRCTKCGRENCAINVARGICTWCGYNTHEDNELQKKIKNKQAACKVLIENEN